MKRRAGVAAAILFALSASAFGAEAPKTKLAGLLGMAPDSCLVMIGTADAGRVVQAARYWLTGPVAEVHLPQEQRAMIVAAIGAASRIANGPVVVAMQDKGTMVCLVATGRSLTEIRDDLAPLAGATLDGDVLLIGPPKRPLACAALHDNVLVAAEKRDTLQAFLKQTPPAKPLLLLLQAKALARDDVQQATAFLFVPRPAALGKGLWPQEEGAQHALMRHLADACGWQTLREAPVLACFDSKEDGFRFKAMALTGDGASVVEAPAKGRIDALAEAFPVRVVGHGINFGGAVDFMAEREVAFDKDAGAEFRQEMAEFNRDFGGDLQKDLLAALGSDWAIGVLPPDDKNKAPWAFVCALRDRDKFIAGAAKLAKVSQEPWAEGKPVGDVRRFSSRAFTVPLEIGVTNDTLIIASSSAAVEAVLPAAAKPIAASGKRPAGAWEVCLTGTWFSLARALPAEPWSKSVREAWAALPQEAGFSASLSRTAEGPIFEATVRGTPPEVLVLWLQPFIAKAQEGERPAAGQ